MKKFIKLYWPMMISISFLIIYGIMIGTVFYSETIFENDVFGIIMVILTLLFVIAIYGEMIYFIIKACKNKDLKHKGLWCVGLYLFHIALFPYFNLKYVCGEKKVKSKMFLFVFLVFISLLVGFYIPVLADNGYKDRTISIVEDGVKIKFTSGFKEIDVGEFDFYVKDRRRQINFGGFVYDEDDNDTANDVMVARDHWIKTTRGTVTILDTITEETDDSIINTNIYIGTNDGIKNMYYISTVEFKNSNCFVNVISTYLHDDYLDYKDELLLILKNMEYIENKEL